MSIFQPFLQIYFIQAHFIITIKEVVTYFCLVYVKSMYRFYHNYLWPKVLILISIRNKLVSDMVDQYIFHFVEYLSIAWLNNFCIKHVMGVSWPCICCVIILIIFQKFVHILFLYLDVVYGASVTSIGIRIDLIICLVKLTGGIFLASILFLFASGLVVLTLLPHPRLEAATCDISGKLFHLECS